MKALKAFVIWLLLSVIPLQGVAANVVMSGNAVRHSAVQTSGIAHEAMHQIHHRDVVQQEGVLLHDDRKQPNDSCDSGHAQAPGGSCATFCPLFTWMSVADIVLPVVESASERISYIAFHVPFVVPERPEHPPRFLSL